MQDHKKPEIWKIRAPIPKFLHSQAHRVQNHLLDIQGLWLLQEPDLWALLWKFDTFHLSLEIKLETNFKTLPGFEEHRVLHCALFFFAFVFS